MEQFSEFYVVDIYDEGYKVFSSYERARSFVVNYYLDHLSEWIEDVGAEQVKEDLLLDMRTLHDPMPYVEDVLCMHQADFIV